MCKKCDRRLAFLREEMEVKLCVDETDLMTAHFNEVTEDISWEDLPECKRVLARKILLPAMTTWLEAHGWFVKYDANGHFEWATEPAKVLN